MLFIFIIFTYSMGMRGSLGVLSILGTCHGQGSFDRQLVAGHIVTYVYKHILRWSIQFKD